MFTHCIESNSINGKTTKPHTHKKNSENLKYKRFLSKHRIEPYYTAIQTGCWLGYISSEVCLTSMFKTLGSTFSTGQSSLWYQRTGNRRQERTQISCHLSFSEHGGTHLCSVHLGSGDRRIRSLRQPRLHRITQTKQPTLLYQRTLLWK